ncbi:hypothetical protein CB0940_07210 [Lecanosticta acicola]|uniref:Uncharacterized protein n=1 Tax=Lecanosticta acicola TaxID=111012 RepID=A0AAI9E8C1_9PEZI|nr:hypothetical protein CB0940_07210 [Lecanosticta acicola]
MTVYQHNEAPNAFVRIARKLYNPIGFHKGYNFTLLFIFGGALLGFALARTPYLNVNDNFLPRAAPGEAYWYRQSWYNIGISIHLLCIIPAAILAIVQFIPIIRYRLLLLHRINGYLVVLLLLVSNVGALMIARRAFGGTPASQACIGTLAIGTTTAAILAYINIKRLQIEQHRAWMLRCFFWLGCTVTERIIQIIAVQVISMIGSYYVAIPCQQITGAGGDASRYLSCQADADGWAVVHAAFSNAQGVEEVAAIFQLTFAMSLWLAFAIHVVGVEVYLHLTKAETERLRKVSYERQLERGMRHPGSEGLTADRLGDVEPWRPSATKETDRRRSDSDSNSSNDTITKPKAALGWE